MCFLSLSWCASSVPDHPCASATTSWSIQANVTTQNYVHLSLLAAGIVSSMLYLLLLASGTVPGMFYLSFMASDTVPSMLHASLLDDGTVPGMLHPPLLVLFLVTLLQALAARECHS